MQSDKHGSAMLCNETHQTVHGCINKQTGVGCHSSEVIEQAQIRRSNNSCTYASNAAGI